MPSFFSSEIKYDDAAFELLKSGMPADPQLWLDAHTPVLGGSVVLSASGSTRYMAPDVAMFALRRGFRVATSSKSGFGRRLTEKQTVSGLIDVSTKYGLAVYFDAVSTPEVALRDSEWSNRTSAAQEVFCARERFRSSLDGITPDEIRKLVRPVLRTKAPEDWLLCNLHLYRVRFVFMGGSDRCHGYVDYKRVDGKWTKGELHA